MSWSTLPGTLHDIWFLVLSEVSTIEQISAALFVQSGDPSRPSSVFYSQPFSQKFSATSSWLYLTLLPLSLDALQGALQFTSTSACPFPHNVERFNERIWILDSEACAPICAYGLVVKQS